MDASTRVHALTCVHATMAALCTAGHPMMAGEAIKETRGRQTAKKACGPTKKQQLGSSDHGRGSPAQQEQGVVDRCACDSVCAHESRDLQ
ncbi:MAG: hypothetical protein J3K34DRAFT_415453 [Monoraphidium minutum]|nr:MAG: hypothetical protein J3K34DRAFT_415453 [Monoraphidium minutum]